MSADWVRLAPDTPAAHAALKAARELTRAGDYALALDVLAGQAVRETPLGRLLRADRLLALGRAEAALSAAEAVAREHGDTGQGLLCAGQARLALGDRPGAAEAFARAGAADPGRIAARVNAAALAGPPKPLPPATTPAAAVTSLPPTAGRRCRLALASWRAAGFSTIVSVNAVEEIAALAERFPEVAYVAARETAKADYGRACPAVDEMLAAGADVGAPAVAVLNADIVLAVGADFAARLGTAARGGLVAGCLGPICFWPWAGPRRPWRRPRPWPGNTATPARDFFAPAMPHWPWATGRARPRLLPGQRLPIPDASPPGSTLRPWPARPNRFLRPRRRPPTQPSNKPGS